MTYVNPVLAYGVERFVADAPAACASATNRSTPYASTGFTYVMITTGMPRAARPISEDARHRHPGIEGRLRGALNRRSVGERVAERHADLDEVRARGLDELERRERRFGGGMARGEVRDERRTAPAPCPQGAPARGDRVLRQSDR